MEKTGYNKIYNDLQYNTSKLFTNDDEVFMKRLKKSQEFSSNYLDYDEDISYIQQNYGRYEDFLIECENVKDKLYQNLKPYLGEITSEYQKYKDVKLDIDYKQCTLQTGHNYLSIDIHSGGFQSLIYLGIIKDISSWDELIHKCTSNDLIIKSKGFRLNFLEDLERICNVDLHIFIISLINEILKSDIISNNFKDVIPNLFLGDELVYDITGHYNEYDKFLGNQFINGIYVNVDKFKYTELGFLSSNRLLNIFPIRKYKNEVVMPYRHSNLYWIYFDYYHNIEPDESDYMVQVSPTLICKCEFNEKIITGKELEEYKGKYKIIM